MMCNHNENGVKLKQYMVIFTIPVLSILCVKKRDCCIGFFKSFHCHRCHVRIFFI